ncbi:molybdenum cofactor biosynthesis enzyme [Nocardiopsis sp. TSRI0078]|uniref:radical SAM protein n=1 Tax=unclassified Nocardiopsis TaxID=2649073 RepID=UPI0009393F3C|nr:radical SAM protein [Nocardiopsis sp. TSRI0078]OKI17089.1 molybdenum cofactor biosynthesis enzyme [Nocardiopsis sp. TSRI0078]
MNVPLTPKTLPTHIDTDTTLRVKILDACGMTCTFCHNEGTPVVVDNRNRGPGPFTTSGTSGRMSIYAATNGATFLPATISPDEGFAHALNRLRDHMGFTELHLTGGEPTLHPRLPDLVRLATAQGYRVCMTSNGENGARQIPACAEAGLDRVNFSVFGTTPEELAQVQHARFRDPAKAATKIKALHASIQACVDHGVRASANIVVLDHAHIDRVHRLLDTYAPELSVRLLNSLDHGQVSIDAIHELLAQRGAVAEAHHLTAGASGARTAYRIDDGRRRIHVKWIRPVRLPTTCQGCRFNNDTDCQEGFYGMRLYRDRHGRYLVGVCLQRMDLCQPIEDFLNTPVKDEILRFRRTDRGRLEAAHHAPTTTAHSTEGNPTP